MNLRLYLRPVTLTLLAALALAARAAPQKTTVTVATDGSGQFRTVQDAIDSAPNGHLRINIKPGTYRATVHVTTDGIELHGLGARPQDTVLVYDNSAGTPGPDGRNFGTGRSGTITVSGDDFTAENLTIANDWETHHARTEEGAQAVALHTTGDRGIYRHVRFLGFQDTLYADSKFCHTPPTTPTTTAANPSPADTAITCYAARDYFSDCYIEGHVDFIFGDARAVFDHCEIHTLPHSMDTITAQSRLRPSELSGYIFRDCTVTADLGTPNTPGYADSAVPPSPSGTPGSPAHSGIPDILLGRPWRDYSTVIWINTNFKAPLDPAGWKEWGGRLKTSTYAEYNSTGQSGDPTKRIAPSKQLTPADLPQYSTRTFLSPPDNWNPESPK